MAKKSYGMFIIGVLRDNDIKIDLLFKLLLIGDSGVGKTCVLFRFVQVYKDNKVLNTKLPDFPMTHSTRPLSRQLGLTSRLKLSSYRARYVSHSFVLLQAFLNTKMIENQTANLGHGRPGAVPHDYHQLLQV